MKEKRSRARKETMHFRFLSCRFAERHDAPKRHKLDIIVGTLCRHRNKVLRQPCLVSFTAIKFTISKGYILLFVITLLFPGTTRLRRCVCVHAIRVIDRQTQYIFPCGFCETDEALPIAPYPKVMFLTLLLSTFLLSDEGNENFVWLKQLL